jgi:hypothetical protein
LNAFKSILKSIPPVHKAARRAKQYVDRMMGFEASEERFSTLSPNVLIARVKAVSIQ